MTRTPLALVLALAACGRVGFSERTDATGDSDATPGDGAGSDATQCTVGDWSPSIVRLANLSVDDVNDWEPALPPDELTIVFSSYRNGPDSQLFVATRATRAADFSAPVLIPGFGSLPGLDVFGPAWSIDGTQLYFTADGNKKMAPYLGNGQFGPVTGGDFAGDSPVFVSSDDLFATANPAFNDYELERYQRDLGGSWVQDTLPAAYNRTGAGNSDGWPTFDRPRRVLYFEHATPGTAIIARVALDSLGALPATFETLDALGTDLGDPELSADGLRLYVGATRRAGTDNDIYMFERPCL